MLQPLHEHSQVYTRGRMAMAKGNASRQELRLLTSHWLHLSLRERQKTASSVWADASSITQIYLVTLIILVTN